MPEDLKNPAIPDIHPGNAGPLLCKALCVPGMILLTSNDDGTIGLIAHGIGHARANEMLSRGVQINLNQHDEMVRSGLAGAEAASTQALCDVAGVAQ